MRYQWTIAVGLVALLSGCDQFALKPVHAPAPATQAAPPSLPSSGGILAPGSLEEMARPDNAGPALAPPANSPPATNPTANAPPVIQEAAGVGSGIKGRSLEQPGTVRLIAQPAITFFRTKEELAYNILVVQAMNLYKAEHGEGPKSHDEFMEKIIGANNIKLPALRPGHRYIYDPTMETLMVERPVQQ